MSVTKEEVKYIAKLSKLKLSEEDAIVFADELENILEQFKILDKLNLEDLEIENSNVSVVREDLHIKYDNDDLYINSKKMRKTYIEVPKIIE